MRLISFQNSNGQTRTGGVRNTEIVDLNATDAAIPTSMRELLAGGSSMLEKVHAAIQSGKPISRDSVKILAPVPDPQKIFGIGLNYADHARETGKEIPTEPIIFCKLPTAVRAHGESIIIPRLTNKVDYEAELVVVIGKQGRHIAKESAMDHVAGYCCGNDVSARDWQTQKPGGQWLLGKSFDTFAPFGPELVTADEVDSVSNLRIQSRIDQQTMQDSTTSQLIFDIPHLINYISGCVTLMPGDVIFTGTPPGVGVARKPPVYLQPGQTIEIEIEKIGSLTNPIVAE